MKKNFLLIVTFLVLNLTFTQCKPQEEKTKNYYGVQSENPKANQEAYIAFFCVSAVSIIGVLYLIKKLKKK